MQCLISEFTVCFGAITKKIRGWLTRIGLMVSALLLCGATVAQTWLPAPPPVDCAANGLGGFNRVSANPSPIEAGKPYQLATKGGQGGFLQQYYFEQVGAEIRIHLRTAQNGPFVPPRCYVLPSPPLVSVGGGVDIVWYEYGNVGVPGVNDIFLTTPLLIRNSLAVASAPFATPTLSVLGVLLAAIVLVLGARSRLKLVVVAAIFHLIAPPLFVLHI